MKISKKKKRYIILSVCLVLLIIFFWYENKHLAVDEYQYQSSKVNDSIDGYKIVQISDLHNARFGRDNKRLIKKIKECNPNIIVLTGDIVDSNHTNIKVAVRFAEEITSICDVYYVTGNHEYWLSESERNELLNGLNKAGVKILDNQIENIEYNGEAFNLIGLDDMNLYDNTLKELVAKCNDKVLNIVLAHEPQYIDDYATSNVDIVLSGHAHGGQFILPFIGGVVAPDQGVFPKYTEGKHVVGNTTMYISRGLGNSVIPVRLFNNPELVCITLKK